MLTYKSFPSIVLTAFIVAACGGTAPDSDVVNGAAQTSTTNAESAIQATGDVVAENTDALQDTWTVLEADWESIVPEISDQWAQIDPAELIATGGNKNQLVMLLQQTYGIDQSEAEQQLSEWAAAR